MLKYDLMLAEWASGSITNRFPVEFWVYKVISRKTVIRRLRRLRQLRQLQKSVTIGFIGYIRSGQLRSNRL